LKSLIFLSALLLSAICLPEPGRCAVDHQPASATAMHRLEVSFDLDAHRLQGNSQIEVPAGDEARLYLDGLTISSLLVDGQVPAAFKVGADTVLLAASATVRTVTIAFAKTCAPAATDSQISRDGIALTGAWHPVLSMDCRFALTARIPDNFEAISEAETITTTRRDHDKLVTFTLNQPLSALTLVAGPYVVEKTAFGQGKELYSYFFSEDQDLAGRYREKARQYLERYEKLLTSYPYKRFSVVENRLPTGFAVPTFTLLGQAVVRLPFIVDTSLGHEILHEWFGNSVRMDTSQGNWAEGLTTYLADQAFAVDEGQGATFRKEQLVKYQSLVPATNTMKAADFVGGVSHLEKDQELPRAIGYNKVGMLFHMLRRSVGDEAFFTGLRDFVSRMRSQPATWSDLITSLTTAAGHDLTDFFEQWLQRADLPSLAVQDLSVKTEAGQPVVSFTLSQENAPPYQLEVPITLRTAHGEIRRTVTLAAKEAAVQVPLATEPLELVVDEDYDLMRRLVADELPPVWSRFQGATDKIVVQGNEADRQRFAPLMTKLTEMGCRFVDAGELQDDELGKASLLFLGTDSKQARALFAKPPHPATGFTLDVHPNPLNPEMVAVLVSTASLEETQAAVPKLGHYGKYGFLHFEGGRVLEKRSRASDIGMIFQLSEAPSGMAMPNTLSYEQILDSLLHSRVVYVGETHDSYRDHVLQLNLVRDLYQRDHHLAIGMEMFNGTSQAALDRFVAGEVDERAFLKESHYFQTWGFDYRLYRDVLAFARAKKIPVLGLNLEKKTVSTVFKDGGLAALDEATRAGLPEDRDLDLPGYRERLKQAFGAHGPQAAQQGNFTNFLQAQALWDETMAASIAAYLTDHTETRMVVLAGRGHVAKDTAIPPRLSRRLDVPQSVIMNVDGEAFSPGQADFIILAPAAELEPPAQLGVMLKEDTDGVRIAGLSPHGPAMAAGFKEKDLILALDGTPMAATEDIKIHLLYKKKGDHLTVRLQRARPILPDRELDVEMTL